MDRKFNPSATMLGGYHKLDGAIEFFGRVATILKPTDVVLDLGAGRGAWFLDDPSEVRREMRNLKDKVHDLIVADVDPIVLTHPAAHSKLLITDHNKIPLPDHSVDVIISYYVLEHVVEPKQFFTEIHRVLKPEGFFCARTPHKYCYVSIFARLIKNKHHVRALSFIKPSSKKQDIFPTVYKCNTLSSIRKYFQRYKDYSYLYAQEPAYFFGRKFIYNFLKIIHKFAPEFFSSNIYIFLQKPSDEDF